MRIDKPKKLLLKSFVMNNQKLNRNDPCWCDSGKKYKKCHLDIDLKKNGTRFFANASPFQGPIKTKEEIEKIRTSSQLTSEILTKVTDLIKPGVTTNEINQWVHEYTLKNNAIPAPLNYKGFPKSICTSINEVICHGIPEDRELNEGDIINVDVTCIINGFYGDASRMYKVGKISKEAEQLIDITEQSLYKGIEAVKPGNTTGDIGYVIEEFITPYNYGIVREYGGHGIGRNFHEDPHIHHFGKPKTGTILEPGMVFTIEPMINEGTHKTKLLSDGWTVITADSKLSAQWEHTICVTETGVDILTK